MLELELLKDIRSNDKSNGAFEHPKFIKYTIKTSRMISMAHRLLTNFSDFFYIGLDYVIT